MCIRMFEQIADAKGHFCFGGYVLDHFSVHGYDYVNCHRQEHNEICPDSLITSPAVDSAHYYRS